MEMPFHLKTLPPEALSVLRYFGESRQDAADAEQIIAGSGLTERGFGKAIRRLVTKQYVTLDGSQMYRLSANGSRAAADLLAYEQAVPPAPAPRPALAPAARVSQRRLIIVAPKTPAVGEAFPLLVGFDGADGAHTLSEPISLLISVSALNGEPSTAVDTPVTLGNAPLQQSFDLTPAPFTRMRVRVAVSQLSADGIDFEPCGGMHIDLPIAPDAAHADATRVAYGASILLNGA